MPKISHNESQILSKSLLGALLGPLGRPFGPILKKTLKKLTPLEANLGVKIDKKSKKINVKKRFVLRDVLFSKFLEFSMDLRAPKPGILNQFLQ